MRHALTGNGGKGGTRRHTSDQSQYDAGYDRIWGKKDPVEEEEEVKQEDKPKTPKYPIGY